MTDYSLSQDQNTVCDYTRFMGNPQPIALNRENGFNWDKKTRLNNDVCAYRKQELESRGPGIYQLTGNDPHCKNMCEYADTINDVMHFPKQIPNPLCYVDEETSLKFSDLTNKRVIDQLFARPYAGFFAGPGQPSPSNKDLETALFQGVSTTQHKACEVSSGQDVSHFYFNILPDYGNPQKVERVINPPVAVGGWIRGGQDTRQEHRNIDYQRRCLNLCNNKEIYRHRAT